MRISDWSSDVCSSDLLEAAAARERVPMAEAWASSADACPSAVPIGAAAAVPWLAIPSEPDVKEVNTRSEERRVGKECVGTCRSRGSTDHYKTTHTQRVSTTSSIRENDKHQNHSNT